MNQNIIERMIKTEEDKRLYWQECAILDATELICKLMKQKGVSCFELARRLGKFEPYITHFLAGEANITVRALSDIVVALGSTICFRYSLVDPQVPESIHQRTQLSDNVLIVSMTPMVAKKIP